MYGFEEDGEMRRHKHHFGSAREEEVPPYEGPSPKSKREKTQVRQCYIYKILQLSRSIQHIIKYK